MGALGPRADGRAGRRRQRRGGHRRVLRTDEVRALPATLVVTQKVGASLYFPCVLVALFSAD